MTLPWVATASDGWGAGPPRSPSSTRDCSAPFPERSGGTRHGGESHSPGPGNSELHRAAGRHFEAGRPGISPRGCVRRTCWYSTPKSSAISPPSRSRGSMRPESATCSSTASRPSTTANRQRHSAGECSGTTPRRIQESPDRRQKSWAVFRCVAAGGAWLLAGPGGFSRRIDGRARLWPGLNTSRPSRPRPPRCGSSSWVTSCWAMRRARRSPAAKTPLRTWQRSSRTRT